MAIVTPKTLYQDAIQNHYGLGAFNVFSFESIMAVMEAAEENRSPAIIQVSMGTRNYVRQLKTYVWLIKKIAAAYKAPVFIQHDHCQTRDACLEAVDAGCQAVMFDGSHLSYEENIKETSLIVHEAHEKDVWVEAELGCLPGFEDTVFAGNAVYTDPEKAVEFIDRTGCDALAISVGTSHGGVRADDYLPLDLDRLKEIVAKRSDYPYVLHGAASLPPELIKACNEQGGKVEYLRNCSEAAIKAAVEAGVRKVNMDVDNFLVFTTAIRKFFNTEPEIYDPRKYLKPAAEAWKQEVSHKMRQVLNSSGRF